jgi:hypothetical protein
MTPWGVGCYDDGTARVVWEISHEEIRRDIDAAQRALRTLGVGPGEPALFCSMLSEAGQFWPLVVGAMLVGAQLSCADATEADAARVAMFTRQLRYRAVVGVDDAVLDGLDGLGLAYGDVFGRVPVVAARPGAYERLRAAGLAPHRFVLCGPAVAVAAGPDAPAHVDPDEWVLGADGTRIVVTSRRERATTFDRAPTAVEGSLVDGGVVPRAVTRT